MHVLRISTSKDTLWKLFKDHVTRNHGRLDAVGRMQALFALVDTVADI